VGWVGLGQSADGLGWIGSNKVDLWTTPVQRTETTERATFVAIGRIYAMRILFDLTVSGAVDESGLAKVGVFRL